MKSIGTQPRALNGTAFVRSLGILAVVFLFFLNSVSGQCPTFGNISVAQNCVSSNTYNLSVCFKAAGLGNSTQFALNVGGAAYGPYAYAAHPGSGPNEYCVTLNGLAVDGETNIPVTIIDLGATPVAPLLDGAAVPEAAWGTPIATSDDVAGWPNEPGNAGGSNVNVNDLYFTSDDTYLYFGANFNTVASWQTWGFVINTGIGGSFKEIWNYPIDYGHSDLPDFAIRGNFTGYAEMRIWDGANWIRRDNNNNDSGLNNMDFRANPSGMVEVRIKKTMFGNPASLNVQFYVSGNIPSDHGTFDAVPNDQVADSWNECCPHNVLDNYTATVPVYYPVVCAANTTYNETACTGCPTSAPLVRPIQYCQGATAAPLIATNQFGGTLIWYTSNPANGSAPFSTTAPTPSTDAPGVTSYWVAENAAACVGPAAELKVYVTSVDNVSCDQVCENINSYGTKVCFSVKSAGPLDSYRVKVGNTTFGPFTYAATQSSSPGQYCKVLNAVGNPTNLDTNVPVTVIDEGVVATATPVMNGSFDGKAIWGNPWAVADSLPGWAGANAKKLYIAQDDNYVYLAADVTAAPWQEWGFAINTKTGGGGFDSWGHQIDYQHTNKPDMVVRGSFGGYAELHTWIGANWVGLGTPLASTEFGESEAAFVEVRIPKTRFGSNTNLSVQFYVTGDNTEHGTFDAVPNDQVADSWNECCPRNSLDTYSQPFYFEPTGAVSCSGSTLFNEAYCFECPTLGSVTAPAQQCLGSNFTINTQNLSALYMNQLGGGGPFGIRLVAHPGTVAPTDPYVGGTDLGTINNANLTNNDANAVLANVGSNLTAGDYTLCALLSPAPNDPTCRPYAVTALQVVPPPTAFAVTGGGSLCATDVQGLAIGLSGSQAGVNYQLMRNGTTAVGTPIAGTGNPLTFTAQTQIGTYTVVATRTVGAACSAMMSGAAQITVQNCNAVISDPCSCLNNATTLTDGQFGETITVNAPVGQTWTVSAVTGLFRNNSDAPPADPLPITAGMALTAVGNGTYTLKGRHVDAQGYSVTVSNGRGTALTVTNTCQYPNPAITSNLVGPFCPNSYPIILTGTPGDPSFFSQGFNVNGNATSIFNPGAGAGQYEIAYTINGGMPHATGASDPGCIQTVTKTVEVIATPSVLICNTMVEVALDNDCSVTVYPDIILIGDYGCWDDYLVTITGLGGTPNYGNTVTTANAGQTLKATITHLISGNTCAAQLSVKDPLPPTIQCQTLQVSCGETNLAPTFLANTLGITAAWPSISDNCGNVTRAYTDEWVDLPCPPTPTSASVTGFVARKWTATDVSGNTATCVQHIEVVGSRVQDVQFPPEVEVDCATGSASTLPDVAGAPYITFNYPSGPRNYNLLNGSVNCELQVAYDDQILPICDGTHKILRTWTAYDWCLPTSVLPPNTNPVYYVQLINVVDKVGPAFTCPANLTVSTSSSQCCAYVDLPDVAITENCSRIHSISAQITLFMPGSNTIIGYVDTVGKLVPLPNGDPLVRDTLGILGFSECLPLGLHQVVYRVSDHCDNLRTCQFTVQVSDNDPPVAICDQTTVVAIGLDGTASIPANSFSDGSYDGCGPVYFKARRLNSNTCQANNAFYDEVTFCCSDIGSTSSSVPVILRVYDTPPGSGAVAPTALAGHFSECSLQIEVQDKNKPICAPPANVTVSCEAFDPSLGQYGQPFVDDNCSNPTMTTAVEWAAFDTLCNRGTINRHWSATDLAGNNNQCSQRIVVAYDQNYWLKFPADRLVSVCDGTTNYGEPEFYGENCELLATSYTDEFFTVIPDACFKIERTWRVINWCTYNVSGNCITVPNPSPHVTTNHPNNLPGVTVSPAGTTVAGWQPTLVKINPTDPAPTNYSVFWNKDANCYTYKQIIKVYDTQAPVVAPPTTEHCDLGVNEPEFWNGAQFWDPNIGSNDLCEGEANLEITATDACSGHNLVFRYRLFLDLDGNGNRETVVNSEDLPDYGFIHYDNANTPNYTGGTPWAFDLRTVPENQKWGFALQVDDANGNSRTARVRWLNELDNPAGGIAPELPHGKHQIQWLVADGCGNEAVYTYDFIVKDCKKPTVVCKSGLSVNIVDLPSAPGTLTLWTGDFLEYVEDNCSPPDFIRIGIRRVGEPDGQGAITGFPKNADGSPQTNVTFTCVDLGNQAVEIWAMDLVGNADFCLANALIQDNDGVCGDQFMIGGRVKTELDEGIEDAYMELEGMANNLPVLKYAATTLNGEYLFSSALPMGGTATIKPLLQLDPLNGVNTWDLILISRHILAYTPLSTPYRLIAADANRSGTVTTFDIVELRKLILGTYAQLPNNTSWRFIDAAQVFTQLDNPFADTIREVVQIVDIQSDLVGVDFVATKVGDVDASATPNGLLPADDRRDGTLLFDLEDRTVEAGATFTVHFKAADLVAGYQFTMVANGLELVDIHPGAGMTLDNFGVHRSVALGPELAITTSADGTPGAFALTFRAVSAGQLSQMLSVSSAITPAVAFASAPLGSTLDVAFRWHRGQESTVAGVGFELYQNTPNPFTDKTAVGFHLPEASTARLSIFDALGRLLYTTTQDFEAGYNTLVVDRAAVAGLPAVDTSVWYYTLETATHSATRKMVGICDF